MRWFVRRREYEDMKYIWDAIIKEQELQIATLQTERSHLLHEIKLLRDRIKDELAR